MRVFLFLAFIATCFILLSGCYAGSGYGNSQVYYKFNDSWYYNATSNEHLYKFGDSWYYNATTGDSIFIFGE